MITLGKHRFVVPIPQASRTWAMQQRLIPVAGNLAGVLVPFIGKGDLKAILSTDVVEALPQALPGLGRVFSEMPANELDQLMRVLLGDPKLGTPMEKCATCDDVRLFSLDGADLFDTIMYGRTWDTWKLLAHALEVWYPDFFGHVRPLLAAKAEAVKPSEASSTSPTSGPGAG